MKKINLRPLLYAALLLIVTISCKDEVLNKPNVTNTTPPGVVSNVKVVNKNGKALLTYTIPSDQDLAYVKAVYETTPGVVQEVKASYYTNQMELGGYADTLPHIVKLYAVNNSEISSAPISVTVNPLTPAYKMAFKTLTVSPAFGGYTVRCDNPTLENLSIITMVDTLGKGKYIQTIGMDNVYSNAAKIVSVTRSQPAVPRKYGFLIRDRWLNQTDTMFQTITPIFEMMISKKTPAWTNYVLTGDTPPKPGSNTAVSYIYNGNYNNGWSSIYFGDESAAAPTSITLNLGVQHTLSRFQINPYIEIGNAYYVRGNVKNFEIWGSNAPNLSGAFDNTWTLLNTYTVVKPSGGPLGTETAADYAAGHAGWQFDIPEGKGAFQYIRIRNLSNWQGSYFMSISQFTLWGQ